MNSKDITVTQGRFNQALKDTVNRVTAPQIDNKVNTAVQNERIRTGIITKFYPYLDKAEVRLDKTHEKILCKILHRFGGDLIDFYTPIESERIFDESVGEPAIIPRSKQHVCVLRINDEDSKENIILGYYQNEDVVGFKPANPGNMKLTSLVETNQFWIKFGYDGLNIRVPSEPTISVGELKQDMEDIIYASSEEVYTKAEVDERVIDATLSVDSDLSDTSSNPVQNKVIKGALDDKVNNNDGRLSDARTPTPHSHSASEITGLSIPSTAEEIMDTSSGDYELLSSIVGLGNDATQTEVNTAIVDMLTIIWEELGH